MSGIGDRGSGEEGKGKREEGKGKEKGEKGRRRGRGDPASLRSYAGLGGVDNPVTCGGKKVAWPVGMGYDASVGRA